MAKIMKSIWGEHWVVEEYAGRTLYYTHHETKQDAVKYCKSQNIEYKILN